MRIENKLTLAHLKQNKRRTIVTLIGIVISVAMIVSVFIGIASFMNYYERSIISMTSNYHFGIREVSEKQLEILRSDERIESIGLQEYGKSDTSGVRLKGAKSLRHSTGYVNWYNDDAFKQMDIEELEGAFPKNNNEILISQAYIDNNNLDWKIGDTITLQLGRRHDDVEYDYFHLSKTGDYVYGEVFDFVENRSFVISGIIKDKRMTWEEGQMYSVCDENSSYYASVKLKKLNPFSIYTIRDIAQKLGANPNNMGKYGIGLNDDLLASHFCGSLDGVLVKKYIPIGLSVLLIILVAAFMLIYNAFGISLNERTKYLGMLSSVGATRRQKLRSMYFEGVVLSAIGIPIGTILGTVIMAIAMKIVSNGNYDIVAPRFVFPLWTLALGIIFCLATIFISLSIPAKKVSNETAIEAIKGSNTVEYKSSRSPFLIKKLFGFEGALAYKNFRRNGKKNRIITASIAISVVLFLCVNYFCSLATELYCGFDAPYQVSVSVSSLYKDTVINDIKEMDGIEDVFSINSVRSCYGKADFDLSSDRAITEVDNTTKKYKNLWKDVDLDLWFIDNDAFDTLCKNNGIDPKPYYETDGKNFECVIMNNIDHKKNGNKVFNDNISGCVIKGNERQMVENEEYAEDMGIKDMTDEEIEEFLKLWNADMRSYTITGMVDYDENNYVCNLNPPRTISAYAPYSSYLAFHVITEEDIENDDCGIVLFGAVTDEHERITEEINLYFDSHPEYAEDAGAFDEKEYPEKMAQMVKTLKMFTYGFILLISIITLANIINTITTSINLRKREFAMVKSIGLDPKGFKKMISLESLFYGIEALFVSAPISVGINMFINKKLEDGRIPFEIDLLMYAVVIVAVFLFVGGTMLYSINKAKNDNIIESLKSD